MKIALIALIGMLTACSTVRIKNVEAAEGFSISQYKTFDFYQLDAPGDTTVEFGRNVELLKTAITQQLESKGLKEVNNNPDLLVNIGITVKEKVQTRQTDFRDAPKYMGQRNYSWKSEEVEVGRYKEGTASVHLVDRESNTLVWQGVAESVLPSRTEKIQNTIEEGMELLFQELK